VAGSGYTAALASIMPRVNRDLQRRMAARRERERRRPTTERRYDFEPADGVETVAGREEEQIDGAPDAASPARTPSRASAAPRPAGRQSYRPYSDYGAEYAYVGKDLRRIVLVIGSLLVFLIVLHFVIIR
jgi:hypothetical protein